MSERFPNNSRFGAVKARQSEEKEKIEPKTEKVIEGTAMRRKRPVGEKIKDTFVQGDIHSVGEHLLWDILIPSAKETLADMGHNLVDGMIHGDDAPARSRSRRRRNMTRESTSIDRGTGRGSRRGYQDLHDRRSLYFDDIIVNDEDEADAVLSELKEDIEEYGSAKVTTLYSAIGWDNYIDHTTDDYGWYDLSKAYSVAVRVEGEWKRLIKLPKAEYIGG